MPTDGEELQWIDEHSRAGYVPESEYHDSVDHNLLSKEIRKDLQKRLKSCKYAPHTALEPSHWRHKQVSNGFCSVTETDLVVGRLERRDGRHWACDGRAGDVWW